MTARQAAKLASAREIAAALAALPEADARRVLYAVTIHLLRNVDWREHDAYCAWLRALAAGTAEGC